MNLEILTETLYEIDWIELRKKLPYVGEHGYISWDKMRLENPNVNIEYINKAVDFKAIYQTILMKE